jgi:hypothetical protein
LERGETPLWCYGDEEDNAASSSWIDHWNLPTVTSEVSYKLQMCL